MKSPLSLSAISPVYNEVELLDRQIRRFDAFFERHVSDHEIIIIESGSTDGSAEAADRLERELARVRVVHEATRNGFGAAVRLGFEAATKDLVLTIPVDLPFPLEALSEGLTLIETSDCVLSYRKEDTRSLFRRVQSKVYNAGIKRVLGLPMRTANSAFKLYRRAIVQEMPLRSKGWLLDAEILYWTAERKLAYREIPVAFPEREAGASKVRLSDPIRMLRELIDLKRTLRTAGHDLSRSVTRGSLMERDR